jgi:hypothetical protein
LGGTLSYISSNVAGVLDRISRSYFLPAIQRPFVWQPDQIVALFDSLLKGYPISSFLLWEIKPERRTDWEIYKFIENFRFGDTHNELAEPDGREVILVLDASPSNFLHPLAHLPILTNTETPAFTKLDALL